MNLRTFVIAHRVLKLGSVQEAARALDCPPSTVSAAMRRLQAEIAIPLVATSKEGTQLTLEGVRLMRELAAASRLVLRLAGLAPGVGPVERRAARLATSISTIERYARAARIGSIRKAALEIGIGQPQLTRQLRALERDLGVSLLERHAWGITLAEKGQAALVHAESLERIWSHISKHAERRFRDSLVVAKVGSITPFGRESIVARILALLAAKWHHKMPDAPLFISSAISEELLTSLRSGALDVILLDTDSVPANLNSRIISRSRMMLVAAKGSTPRPADIRDLLLNTPVALLSFKSGLRQKFVKLMEDVLPEGERERLSIVEVDSMPIIANLVRHHGYLTLLPELSLGVSANTYDCVVLPERFNVNFTIVWRPSPSSEKVAKRFFDVLEDLVPGEGLLAALTPPPSFRRGRRRRDAAPAA